MKYSHPKPDKWFVITLNLKDNQIKQEWSLWIHFLEWVTAQLWMLYINYINETFRWWNIRIMVDTDVTYFDVYNYNIFLQLKTKNFSIGEIWNLNHGNLSCTTNGFIFLFIYLDICLFKRLHVLLVAAIPFTVIRESSTWWQHQIWTKKYARQFSSMKIICIFVT